MRLHFSTVREMGEGRDKQRPRTVVLWKTEGYSEFSYRHTHTYTHTVSASDSSSRLQLKLNQGVHKWPTCRFWLIWFSNTFGMQVSKLVLFFYTQRIIKGSTDIDFEGHYWPHHSTEACSFSVFTLQFQEVLELGLNNRPGSSSWTQEKSLSATARSLHPLFQRSFNTEPKENLPSSTCVQLSHDPLLLLHTRTDIVCLCSAQCVSWISGLKVFNSNWYFYSGILLPPKDVLCVTERVTTA